MKLAALQAQNQAHRATPGRNNPQLRNGTSAGVVLLPSHSLPSARADGATNYWATPGRHNPQVLNGTPAGVVLLPSHSLPWSARADGANDPLPEDYGQNRPPIQYSRPVAAALQQGVTPLRGGDNAANIPVPAEGPPAGPPPRTDVTQLVNAFESKNFRNKPEYSLL